MEQAIISGARRAGWSESESKLLWETADEAQQQGLPLKAVFEQIASQTGRRPNSIRNYYYAQAQKRAGGAARTARFVPFTEQEVRNLLRAVLEERAKGHSVRSCLSRMAGGDHRAMLRYQNKYRAVIKARPDLVEETIEALKKEGVYAAAPEVAHRPRVTLQEVCKNRGEGARRQDDPELIRACEVLTRALFTQREPEPTRSGQSVRLDLYRMALEEKERGLRTLAQAAESLAQPVKEFLGLPDQTRARELQSHCARLSERLGALEQCLQELDADQA